MSTVKTGIVLLNMGGPDQLAHVKPFLYNLFSDPDIIRLPFSGLLQKPLAWWISTRREREAQHNYALMGGASPIRQHSETQGALLQQELESRGYGKLPVYVAMRYWHPFTEEAVRQMRKDGIERLVVVPLYPHFSYTTTGSSLNELKRCLTEAGIQPKLSVVPHYFEHPIYLKAVSETIRQVLDTACWSCPQEEVRLLFTAHSLPLKHVERTQDPYPEQIYATAKTIVETYFPQNTWDLSYQSQVGNMAWLGPDTPGVLHYFAGKKIDNVLMVPVSFVSEHVETLVEMDQQFLPLANELGISHCHRAPALNERSTFIQALTALVIAELENTGAGSVQFPNFLQLLNAQAAG